MLDDAPRLCASDFLTSVADAETGNGLIQNAAEFRRRAHEVRTLEKRLAELEQQLLDTAKLIDLRSWLPIEAAPDHVEVITYCPDKCTGYRQVTLNMRVGERWIRSHESHPPTLYIPMPPLPAPTAKLDEAA